MTSTRDYRMSDDAQDAKKFLRARPDKKPALVDATDCPTQIVIIVAPGTRPARYCAYVETEREPLCESRQPFLDSARKLIARGHHPQTMLVMRWAGAKEWALRGPLGVAAKLTVDEHNATFAKWKPLSRSAVLPKIAKSADQVPEELAAEKTARGSTAEKVRRIAPLAEQLGRGSANVR
jgi:hypothetical protein